jgi:hypothetical protein
MPHLMSLRRDEMNFETPYLSVTGVTKGHASRAIVWMRNRSLAAFYKQGELCAFEFKHGREWTYDVMHKALAETSR